VSVKVKPVGRSAPQPAARPAARRPRLVFRIATRIFTLNVLLLLVPVLALGFFRDYERSLLAAQEQSMAQQGRFLAAWLGQAAGALSPSQARAALAALRQRHTARIRVVGPDGSLYADSSVHGAVAEPVAAELGLADQTEPAKTWSSAVESGAGRVAASLEELSQPPAEAHWLYRLMSWPVRLWRRWLGPPTAPPAGADYYAGVDRLAGSEVMAALAGRYGALTRISPSGEASVTLYSALPIQRGDRVAGVVLVSQSTWRILSDLYSLRLAAGQTFAWGIGLALLGTLLLSLTITRPLARLAASARQSLSADGRPQALVTEPGRRPDEIGDLQRALASLSQALQERAARAEAFAADVAHELKNPIASAAASLELLETLVDPVERRRFGASARRELERLREVLGSLRLLATAEARAVGPAVGRAADVLAVLRRLVAELTGPGQVAISLTTRLPERPIALGVEPALLAIAIKNLLENAQDFSPAGSAVRLICGLEPASGHAVAGHGAAGHGAAWLWLLVHDAGPGVPPEHRDRLFQRFFTWRPQGDKRSHSGLGLAITLAIARAGGGDLGFLAAPVAAAAPAPPTSLLALVTEFSAESGALPGAPIGATFWLRLPCQPA